MEVVLCSGDECCPSVNIEEEAIEIGEGSDTVELSADQWNVLVDKVESEELSKI